MAIVQCPSCLSLPPELLRSLEFALLKHLSAVMPRQRVRPLAGPMTGSGGASSVPCVGDLAEAVPLTPLGCYWIVRLPRTMTAEE
jgi:hypothetical protein